MTASVQPDAVTEATLDAAVEYASLHNRARALYAWDTRIELLREVDRLRKDAAAIDAQARADERERIAQAIWDFREHRVRHSGEALEAQRALFQAARIADEATKIRLRNAAAIARAGTSGVTDVS